uniref:BRO1 domain-containing protein n=1 Tax=Caenorhabditis tropicalis TaxID=1561998 RepID=A0A1I7UTB6_9PELO
MEALPTMPMMAPQFRTSTLSYDNIPNFDFRLRMKEHILLTFNADPHEYDAAFDELAQMKFEANIPAASVEQILKLKRYYGQLCMMQKRFPMGAGEQLETPFAWHDGLVDMRSAQSEVTICDIEFEKASVMFNIGACHAQYAAEQPRDTQDSIKTAFSHFQQAATAFEQLNTFRNSDFFYPSVDLDANVITFYYNVLVAQAQECIVQKSLLENRNPLVTAKLSLWLQESYESTMKIVEDWSINVPESVQRYYAKLCRLKSDIYGVIAYMALGDHYEKEDKKMGWRLQYYNIANKFMEHLTTNQAKMRDRYPELFVTSSFLFDTKNAEKENDFIYHDRIPKQEEAIDAAKKEGSVCKVTVPKFNPLDPSVCGADLFEKLLPSHVQDANNKYAEKKDEIYREMKEIVKSFDDHLNYQLQLAEFDKLRFMLKDGKNREAWFEIPEDLMQRNADMTSYPDCVPNLIEKMRESADTARVAEAKLNTLLAKLRAIDLPRLKADEGFNLIQKELERLSEHLQQAKANNVSLNKAIAQHSGNLQILTLPCGEMWQKIVPMEEESEKSSTAQSPEEIQVRKMVAKVEEMQKQRQMLLEELAAELKADDIATKLMGTNERGAEEIMATEITKHATRQSAIRLNVTAQEAILRAFADANADYHEERSEMSKKKAEYEKRVNELCASYEVYRDVATKCDEGNQFYRQLMARCDQFAIPVHAMEEQYREELEKKERAQKEAEHHMNQLRMSREAQNAMMDFGGGPPAPTGPQFPSNRSSPGGMAPPRAPGQRGPRLGDYLDSYRARKQQNPQVQIPQEPDHLPGPPSPTPSSICDFPSTRSQRFGPPSPYSAQPSPAPGPQGYQGPYGGPQGRPQGGPPPGGQYQYQPTPYQAPPPLVPGTPAYQHAATPYPGKPSSYSVPRVVPGYGGEAYGGPVQGGSQHQSYAPSPVQGAPGSQGYVNQPGPSPAQGAPPQNYVPSPGGPPAHHPQYAPSPVQEAPVGPSHSQGYVPSPVQGVQASQSQPQYAPSPVQSFQAPPQQAPLPPQQYAPPTVSQGGVQGYGALGQPSYTPSPVQGGPPQFQNNSQFAPSPVQGGPPPQNQGFRPAQYPPTSIPAPPPRQEFPAPAPPPPPSQYPPQTGFNGPSGGFQGFPGGANSQQYAPSPVPGAPGAPPGAQGYGAFQVPPQQPSYQPLAPPSQPVFQHSPLGAPISAPPPTTQQQHHQHVSPQPPAPAAPAKFTPTPGAPSPWHATPAELKTPWNPTPQYHAPPTGAPAAAQGAPGASGAPATQPVKSNVDLLSDLLGDFNLPPPIQPTVQNSQHLQQSQVAPVQPQPHQAPPPQFQQDFRGLTSNQPDPPQPPRQVVRPAAAVQPMPQQSATPELSQIAQQTAQNATETPILMKGSPSITELADPNKFEMGEGNVQKLEKRLLHESFRTNGPPPPLNQSDPLNHIDAFSFNSITRQK